MSFIAAAIGAGVGIYGANKQAKAQDAATAANLKGFQQYEPYVDAALSGGQGALDGVLATGNYQGPTYAGPKFSYASSRGVTSYKAERSMKRVAQETVKSSKR